jgi:hypothetical protein
VTGRENTKPGKKKAIPVRIALKRALRRGRVVVGISGILAYLSAFIFRF